MRKIIFVSVLLAGIFSLYSEEIQYHSETGFFSFSVPEEWEDVSAATREEQAAGFPPNLADYFHFEMDEKAVFTVTATDTYSALQNNPADKDVTRDMLSYENMQESEKNSKLEMYSSSLLTQMPSFYKNLRIIEKKVDNINNQTFLYFKLSFSLMGDPYICEFYNFLHKGFDIKFTFTYEEKDYKTEIVDVIKSVKLTNNK